MTVLETRLPPRRFDLLARATFAAGTDLAGEPATAGDVLTLDVPVALPWGVEVVGNLFGDRVVFEPNSVTVPAGDEGRVKFLLDHRDAKPFGYGVAFASSAAGLGATFALPRSELADPEVSTAVRQMGNGVRDAVSVGVAFEESTSEDRGDGTFLITVQRARLLEVSTVTIPRFDEARHDPLAAASTQPERQTMTLTAAATTTPLEPDPPPDDPTAPDDLFARLAAHTATLGHLAGGTGPAVTREPHPLARFANFTAYTAARRLDPDGVPDLRAVWADQITTNNPGVLPPAWLQTIYGIVDLGRPFITALGGPASAGDSGMEVNWPYYDGDLATLIAEQTAEKTEINTVRIDIKKGTADLETYAGGSDISYQLLLRSSPSYLAAYERIMAAGYAMKTDTVAGTEAAAASADEVVVDLLTATPAVIAAALFNASLKVQRATGQPATVVACADDVYAAVAAAVFTMGASPSVNVAGASASASALEVNIAGFRVVSVPTLAPGTAIVTNRLAGNWIEDGPRTTTADDVRRLGLDVALWGMGTWATFAATGIVMLVPVASPAAASAPSGRRSSGDK